MQRLNADGHDESQWLPKFYNRATGKMETVPSINPHRAAKGDIKRNTDDKLQAMEWLPDKLYACRIIEKFHLDTCESFFKALVSTRKELGIGDIRGLLADLPPGHLAKPKDIFFSILTGLPKPEANMCLWIVCDEYNRGNMQLACKLIGTIKHGLENAQKIIDSL